MRSFTAWVVLFAVCGAPVQAQDLNFFQRWMRIYSAPKRAPLTWSNSARLDKLIRAGKLYLTLDDALALAVENNLDVELQRLNAPLAQTELERTAAGGINRGLNFTLAEVPAGVGGPSSTLLTSSSAQRLIPGTSVSSNPLEVGALGQISTNLSLQGSTALSTGTAVPVFDPFLSGRAIYQHQTTPQTNQITTGVESLITDMWNAGAGYRQGFTSGAQFNASFDNLRQTTNSIRSAYSPYTTSGLTLSLTQPLLRGFGFKVNRRYQHIAENEVKIVDHLFRQQLINTVYGVTRLYQDFVALYEDVRVKEQTVALAQKLYSDSTAQVEEGTLASVELARANAQVFSAKLDLERSRALLEEQQAILKTVLTRRGNVDQNVREAEVIPMTPLEAPDRPVQSIDELFSVAVQSRSDLAQADLQYRNGELSIEGAKSLARPQMDLVLSATNNGLAGDPNPVTVNPDQTFLGGYSSALAQIFRRNYPSYSAGVQLDLPLRNRQAQADLARDEIQLRQTGIRIQQLRNQARLEVEDAFISVRRAKAAYDAAVQARVYQEESLKAEQAKFEVGASTSFFLIQFQNLLSQARSTEVAARGALAKAYAALDRATGTILEQHKISVDAARQGVMP